MSWRGALRDVDALVRDFGGSRSGWRKMKKHLWVESERTGEMALEDIHWYEHHGIGKVLFKVKE